MPGECNYTHVNGSFTIKEESESESQFGWDAVPTWLGTYNIIGHTQLLEE